MWMESGCEPLADASDWVTLIDVVPPSGAAEHQAVGAILGAEMRARHSVMSILQLPIERHAEGCPEALLLLGLGPVGDEVERRCWRWSAG
jgi:hypothetical protein